MYTCSACQQKVEGGLVEFKDHTEQHIIDLIKHDHPHWQEADGLCPKCYEYYKAEITGSVFKDATCVIRRRKIDKFIEKVKGVFRK